MGGTLTRIDLRSTLAALASTRQLFTCERDFQFALAWQLKTEGHELCLEYEPGCVGKNAAIDLLITHPELVSVELKYRPTAFTHGHVSVLYHPPDVACYGTVLDISRLERVVAEGKASRGVSILLTNRRTLWSNNQRRSCSYDNFRVHEGRELAGSMSFGASASANTHKIYPPVGLLSRYEC